MKKLKIILIVLAIAMVLFVIVSFFRLCHYLGNDYPEEENVEWRIQQNEL